MKGTRFATGNCVHMKVMEASLAISTFIMSWVSVQYLVLLHLIRDYILNEEFLSIIDFLSFEEFVSDIQTVAV